MNRPRFPNALLVADDELWGIAYTSQKKAHGEALYTELGPTRLDQVAKGFGCRGVRIEQSEQLVGELQAALAADLPTVIQVPIVSGSPAIG